MDRLPAHLDARQLVLDTVETFLETHPEIEELNGDVFNVGEAELEDGDLVMRVRIGDQVVRVQCSLQEVQEIA